MVPPLTRVRAMTPLAPLQKVRQALGRMFGFTLDTFSKIETVSSLGLEMKMLNDYRSYSRDYFK